jgi:hypothetical protein
VQCSAVQCSAVQCSAVQCSAVQCSAVQCSAVQCGVREELSGVSVRPSAGDWASIATALHPSVAPLLLPAMAVLLHSSIGYNTKLILILAALVR